LRGKGREIFQNAKGGGTKALQGNFCKEIPLLVRRLERCHVYYADWNTAKGGRLARERGGGLLSKKKNEGEEALGGGEFKVS